MFLAFRMVKIIFSRINLNIYQIYFFLIAGIAYLQYTENEQLKFGKSHFLGVSSIKAVV